MGIFDMFTKDKRTTEPEPAAAAPGSERMSIAGLSHLDAGPLRPAAPTT